MKKKYLKSETFVHAFHWLDRPFESKCKIDLIRFNSGKGIIIMSEMEENEGTSITNASEQIATEIVKKYFLPVEDFKFIETYPYHWKEQGIEFDEVKYNWNGKDFEHPHWRRIKKDEDLYKLLIDYFE